MIRGVRQLNQDARERVVFLFEEAKLEPAASDYQPPISVNVEALLGVPAFRPRRRAVSVFFERRPVRQHKLAHCQRAAKRLQGLFAELLRLGLPPQEWIPR